MASHGKLAFQPLGNCLSETRVRLSSARVKGACLPARQPACPGARRHTRGRPYDAGRGQAAASSMCSRELIR